MARTLGSYAKLTKPKISEIALHLFAERGYAAVSMRQIAAKVGLQVGALYNYFPDKQTILSELLINHMENLLQTWHRQKLPETSDKILEFFVESWQRTLVVSKIGEIFREKAICSAEFRERNN